MRTLMMGMLFCLVSGDDNLTVNVEGFVRRDVLLPCNCPNRNPDKEFRWQAEDIESVLVVKHKGITSNFTDKYKDRAELFLSKDKTNCSLLLKNIKLEDKGKYKCSFKYGGSQHNYSYVDLTVSGLLLSERYTPAPIVGTSPVPTDSIRTLCRLMPVALVAVFSLFLFFLYKRKASGQLNAVEGERALRISV